MFTPVDIQTVEFKKSAFGYSTDEVDKFLDDLGDEFEKLYKENSKLIDKVQGLTEIVRYFKDLEDSIKNSIVLAERNAEDIKKSAEVEANGIIAKAEARAEEILQNTRIEASKLRSEITALKAQDEGVKSSLRAMLETQIKMLEVHNSELGLGEDSQSEQ